MYASVLEVLGIDPESFKWQDLALCPHTPTNNFFDDYESNVEIAKVVDDMCLSCPVVAQCGFEGVRNNEWGVWGGVYLVSGKPSEARNAHKTESIWNLLKERYNE